jgi:hypothetical protein
MAGPPPRPIVDHEDAEEFVAEWMRYAGYRDAERTGRGADRGIDVKSNEAVAQVKFFSDKPVGRPAVQRLHGAAAPGNKRPLFFSSTGYSRHAIEYSEEVGIALFTFSHDGSVDSVNRGAETIQRLARALGPPVDPGTKSALRFLAGVLVVGVAAPLFILLALADLALWAKVVIVFALAPAVKESIPVVGDWLIARSQRRLDSQWEQRPLPPPVA